ncbi:MULTISPECIES: hypothetical protein [unclassified Sphingomonas]|jgi:hypothetical protein|uniref:hypothetical protein n=1 Tax=unclassified Sphingomonas TaxID=196159 RepID=UPI0006F982F0|nr:MULTISPECIES: hypothetical protein [unclassified Sphingomonas]KQN28846.1 hypothetical protein ASE88_07480 [Sphingomonas sp. Leaf38]KQN31965.1 hypothetical protein ASF00_04190 [Sphingomonas sp. Leaf34]
MSDHLRLRYEAPCDGPTATTSTTASVRDASSPTELDRARALIRQRDARSAAFAPVRLLFQDPAWDILLGLFVAYEKGTPLTIDAVSTASGLSDVAIRRWLLALEHRGLITSWPHDADLAARSLGLTDAALTMMLQFLQDI